MAVMTEMQVWTGVTGCNPNEAEWPTKFVTVRAQTSVYGFY